MAFRLSILGAGESGLGAAVLGRKLGYEIFVSDFGIIKPNYLRELRDENFEYEGGYHSEDKILSSDLVVKSPGIPDTADIVVKLREKNIEVISEIEFASRHCSSKIVAITGSNGKTTTSLLTYHILKEGGLNVGLAGNIGESFARQVANDNYDYYVLELSSFQLDGIVHFKPDIAIVLNITPDHLDRYAYKFENYRDSKFRIAMNQDENDYFIYDCDDEGNLEGLENNIVKSIKVPYGLGPSESTGIYGTLNENKIEMTKGEDKTAIAFEELALQGKHNARNSLAGGLAAKILGVHKQNIRNAMASFKSVEHRLENAGIVDGVSFINDSKATNVNAVFHALDSMKKTTVWIVGGVDKGNDYSDLLPFVREKVRAIVCLGTDNTKLFNFFQDEVGVITEAHSMEDAVRKAYTLSRKGDNVLLSPACASFDLFENYEDRGRQFKEEVKKLEY